MNALVCPTARMEKLMVATDGSKYSERAIREAISLAKICSSNLIAVSVVKTNLEFDSVLPQFVEKAEQEAIKHLESVKTQATKEGVNCITIVSRSEEPYEDIVHHASKNNVDMIIMGTHGKTHMKRLMMGSVTALVIGHAPCNVLVLPLNSKVKCKNVLIATDGSKYSEAAASEALGIAKRCGSSLIVISVASSDAEIASAKDNVHKVSEAAEKEGIKTASVVTTGKPYEAIIETSKQKKADLIVVGSHGRTGLARLLMGSVTERVIGHAETAVLVVKA
jgi:nucleotide-binding universal stress UspA family protein